MRLKQEKPQNEAVIVEMPLSNEDKRVRKANDDK